MNTRFILLSAILVFLVRISLGANLLFVTLLAAPSHNIWNEALVGGLLQNGHNITLLGHDKPRIESSNYTVITIDLSLIGDLDSADLSKLSPFQQLTLEWEFQFLICEMDLQSKVFKTLMDYPPDHFEIIIFDVGAGQCYYPLFDYFSTAKVVGVSPFATPPSIAHTMGHEIPSYVPIYSSKFGTNMTFWERTENFLLQTWELLLKHYYLNAMYKKSQEVFGKELRDFYEIEKDIVLLLTNNNPILDYPQVFPTNIIPVGGLHIKPPKKLDDKLQNVLDNAKHGVIYFSMGSIVKSESMKPEVKNTFLNAFRKLKQIVLWKFESDGLDVPENVIIRKWFPQNDILGHKNVILFISHCGGLSTHEAVYHGIPVLGIPIIVDQHNNAARLAHKGGGLCLNYHEITQEALYVTITEIITNPSYKNEMKRLSTLFRDQPIPPLEKAVSWIEYVLRNKENIKNDFSPYVRYMSWSEKYSLVLVMLTFLCGISFICLTLILIRKDKIKLKAS